MTDLTKKDLPDRVALTATHQEAFNSLKKALTSGPVLHGPDFSKEFIIQTDASDVGGLSQMDETDDDHPIAFFSRKLLPREKNYAAVEKECLAIVEGVKHFSVCT